MTSDPGGTAFTGADSYITRQLREAAAALTSHADIQAKLGAIFRVAGHDSTTGGAADAIHQD